MMTLRGTVRAMGVRRSAAVGATAAAALLAAGLMGAPPAMAQASTTSPIHQQCADSALQIGAVDDGEASGAGQALRYLTFTNTGSTVCRLSGAPRVSIVGHGDGTQLGGPAATATGPVPAIVMLAPGEAAQAALAYTVVTEGGGPYDTACQAERADGYRVYPPHSSRSFFLPQPQWACASVVNWGVISAVDTVVLGPHDSTKGCRNTAKVPKGAVISAVQDVDGDTRSDTQFSGAVRGHFVYGVRTAAGGVYTITDPLKGDGVHSGWTTNTDSAGRTITVIDDQRTAKLYAFRSCGFVATAHVAGGAYEFAIGSTATAGTGVACNDRNGGVLLERATAKKRTNGRYDIVWTMVSVSASGRTAKQDTSSTEVRFANLAASDPRVAQARANVCSAQMKVEARQD
jgi:hypothetical protein